jgi:tRNA U34 5-carboxymethylaminomethyl modifying GTPase MnmE/TrmE
MSAPRELRVREISPRGGGGVAVIELRGRGAFATARALAPSLAASMRGLKRVRLVVGDEALDDALAWIDGDEHVELHVHGSQPLVRRLLQILRASGGAEDRELALEQRASELLAHAPCEAAARILLDQVEGALRAALTQVLTLDRDAARAQLVELDARARFASFALEPRQVVLAGPVNAGKSTLFNALFGARRVVVSATGGTTRDAVRERVMFGAWPVDLCDTAGERELGSQREPRATLEHAGQQLGRDARARADLVLWLQPCDVAGAPAVDARTRVVLSCADRARPDAVASGLPRISALAEPAQAVRAVHDLYRAAFALPAEPWTARCAVPFDRESRAAVANALRSLAHAGEDWRVALRACLAPA